MTLRLWLMIGYLGFHLFPSSTGLWAKDTPACRLTLLKRKATPEESPKNVNGYRREPIVSFEVNETGETDRVLLTRSSGSKEVDRSVIQTVKNWKFKPQPGCGVSELKMSVNIHFR